MLIRSRQFYYTNIDLGAPFAQILSSLFCEELARERKHQRDLINDNYAVNQFKDDQFSISLFVTPCVSFSSPDPAILLEMDLAGSGDKNDLLHVERMCYDKQKWISFVACVFPPLLSSFPFLIFFFF